MRALLIALWLAMGITPALIPGDPVLESVSLALVAGALWLSGCWVLRVGLARDPEGATLDVLASGRVGPLAVGLVLALGLLVAAVGSPGVAGLFWLVAGWSFLLAWSRSRDRKQLADRIATALLAFSSVSLCLALAEVVFRSPAVTSRTGGNRPGGARWEATRYDRIWEQNSLRLRSLHLGPKPPGVLRVVALGDSFTWGYYVEKTEEVWPYVFERRLAEAGKRVEVVNLGRNGASTKEEAALLDEVGWLFGPDLVLLQYTLNDPITGPYRNHFRTYPLLPWLNGFLDRRSYFFSFLHSHWAAIQSRVRYPERENGLYRDDFPGWRETRQALQQIADAGRSRAVPVALVVFPLFGERRLDSASYAFHRAHDSVRAAARQAGLEVLDLGPLFWRLGRAGRSWWAVPHDPHPGVEGHSLAGEEIARLLGPRVGAGSEDGIDERRQH